MGYACSSQTTNPDNSQYCPKGYSMQHGDCCNHAWYIAWHVIFWLTLFTCTSAVIFVIAYRRRQKQQQQIALRENQQQAWVQNVLA